MFQVRAMCCAAAVVAVAAAPASAQNFNFSKLTYLTFSGPIQVPGATLPAGTYEFRLADPLSHRQVIQIRDKEGSKIYSTLLSVPNRAAEAKDEPYVMFVETPAGQPAAIKTWFYPGERTGYEFVYPKNQAMRIASYSNEPVLSHNSDMTSDSDRAGIADSNVGRVNAQGDFTEEQMADSGAPVAASTTAQSTTPEPTTAQSTPAGQTETSQAPVASANRTESQAPAARSAQRDATAPSDASAPPRSGAANPDTMAARQLPRTASHSGLVQLMGAALIAVGLALRQRRKSLEARA